MNGWMVDNDDGWRDDGWMSGWMSEWVEETRDCELSWHLHSLSFSDTELYWTLGVSQKIKKISPLEK